jgi:hypothetical protein
MEDNLRISKYLISQRALIWNSSNFKLKLRGQPPIEDDLKILKVEYISDYELDLPQILNLSSGDPTLPKTDWNDIL